jgi:hypothetical protein
MFSLVVVVVVPACQPDGMVCRRLLPHDAAADSA